MDIEKEIGPKIPLPQLTQFRLLSINAERHSMAAGEKLRCEVAEELTLRLEGKSSSASENTTQLRITASIKFDGTWRQTEVDVLVATFAAMYQGKFVFAAGTDVGEVENCMKGKFYRDYLAAQIYPLAQTHMIGELKTMGLNVNRRIGFDAESAKFEKLPTPAIPKKKAIRKKTP